MRKRIILIIACIVALIITVGGVTGSLLYRKHIDKQTELAIKYIDDRKYLEALSLYRKYSGKKVSFDEKVFTELKDTVEHIKKDYMSEDIDYNSAKDQLHSLDNFDIMGFDLMVYDCAKWIDRINASRVNYQDGKTYHEGGDYDTALEKYGLVLEDDREYYDRALADIEIILEEESESQDKLRVPSFDNTIYEHTYTEDDKEIMYVMIDFPILTGNSPSYESINKIIDSVKAEYMIEIDRMKEEARAYKDEEYFISSGYSVSYSVPYNNNGIVCIVLDGYIYSGGAHGYPLRRTLTFDLDKGTLMNLSDLISGDAKAFTELITDEYKRMYDETPEEYWSDSPDFVRKDALNMDNLNYYITEDSICIYYFPYDLASYARGFVEITIPYLGNEWLFSFNYVQ